MQIELVASTPRACRRRVIVSVANDRPSWWRIASKVTGSSARPSRANTVCSDLTVLSGQQSARGLDELAEQLAAEHPVVLELLIAAFEHCDPVAVAPSVGLALEFEALEQIDPQIGHGRISVSRSSSDQRM